ncbi:uncharacterized protein LOC123295928 [Chrysoperla carnea]|uniref:uncharacterized protein LOC123295928 n=1 Tax=Chrysoperla carnea TaxID=189513 RepID=UPI001D06D7C6|nr:uncharacterized protein LOC123295928 [Chrysoperla carnea]
MSDVAKQFAVVEFDEVVNGKKVVELIPISWLNDDEMFCFWPPKDIEHTLQKLVKLKYAPGSDWDSYPIKVISKAKDHEQGLRRLEKSFRKRVVESSESEVPTGDENQLTTMNSSSVADILDKSQQPLTDDDFLIIDDQVINSNNTKKINDKQKVIPELSRVQITDVVDYQSLGLYLESVMKREFSSMRQSINANITDKIQQVLKVVQYSADPPGKEQAWKNIGEELPFQDDDQFMKFDESIKNNELKTTALIDIFKMVTAGSIDCDNDVQSIMKKLIKKDVQLLYSGCGKKIKGIGKKSFKETQTFKEMEKFLKAKYYDSKDKLSILSLVSRFLSGAKDRDGGRANREAKLM